MNKGKQDEILLLKKEIKDKETSIVWANLTKEQCDLTGNIFRNYNNALDILEHFELKSREAPFILLCSVVEGIAGLKYGRKHQTFNNWLLKNNLEIDKLRKSSSQKEFKSIMKKQEESYLEIYGCKRNFGSVTIFAETSYCAYNNTSFIL